MGKGVIGIHAGMRYEAQQALVGARCRLDQGRVGRLAQALRFARPGNETAAAVNHRQPPAGRHRAPRNQRGKEIRCKHRSQHIAPPAQQRHRHIDRGNRNFLHCARDQVRHHGLLGRDHLVDADAHVIGRRRQPGTGRHHSIDELPAIGIEQDGAVAATAGANAIALAVGRSGMLVETGQVTMRQVG
jgi:hypothetical protein